MTVRLLLGDCLVRMADLPKASLGAVVCDPPYDLTSVSRGGSPRVDGTGPFGRHKLDSKPTKGFMGKAWDGTGIAFTSDLWTEVFRVLVPGGVIKVFGGTRTFHRLAAAMEAVGFEDVALVALGYGSGFPKSLDVGKALDKMHGAKRGTRQVAYTGNAVLRAGGQNTRPWMEAALKTGFHELADNTPVTSDAQAWNGWGTALKPAWEPVLVGRKPEGSPDSRSG